VMKELSGDDAIVLYRIAQSLLQECDYGELLTNILDMTVHALGADRGCVVVRENGEYRATVARNFRNEALSDREQEISTTIANTTVQEGNILLVGDAQQVELLRGKKSVRRLQLHSVLCAPLIARDEAFALIYLENRQISNQFKEDDQRLLSEICALVAPRLHIAVAIESSRRRARELGIAGGEHDGIVTADPVMSGLLQTLSKIAPTELPVLIQGATGTGKELVARALYRRSARASGPFVVLNCAAIPPTLIESELFGWVRGAHNMADRDRVGLIGSANRGTLFLDEVGEMPLDVQSRFLRVLQSGDFNRLGSARAERVDVRVIAATNRDLEREAEQHTFREDLYFRLSSVVLQVPPLRERKADVIMLANHFLRVYAGRCGHVAPTLSSECVQMLLAYPFPGNVRELEWEMARLVAMCPSGEEIPAKALNDRISRRKVAVKEEFEVKPMSLAEMEKKLIVAVLRHTENNRTHAADILGISREGLRTKMQRLGLSDSMFSQDSKP
jgi:transcriptional regulator with GAF, ATPase, and Fis domain